MLSFHLQPLDVQKIGRTRWKIAFLEHTIYTSNTHTCHRTNKHFIRVVHTCEHMNHITRLTRVNSHLWCNALHICISYHVCNYTTLTHSSTSCTIRCMCTTLISLQGSEFQGEFRTLLSKQEIKHQVISRDNPQAD